METKKRLIDSKGKFALNAGYLTGHVMCFENGYATVFDRFAKVICKFSLLDAPTVDAVEVIHAHWIPDDYYDICSHCNHPVVMHDRRKPDRYCRNCGAKMDGDKNGS